MNTSKQPPGAFLKKIKTLLPNNKSDETRFIHPIEDVNMIANPASTFNSFFSSAPIIEQMLYAFENDSVEHPSVVTISDQSPGLNFLFDPAFVECVTKLLLNLD